MSKEWYENEKSLVVGSMQHLANREGMSLAQTFMQAEVIILLDCSGSMGMRDAQDGMAREEVAEIELEKLQNAMPGKIALVCFADDVEFSPTGRPIHVGGSTHLNKGLRYIKQADEVDMRFIVISDGEPNSRSKALAIAKTFKNKIDTIFVGSVNRDGGRDFLIELARVSGGEHVTMEKCLELSAGIMGLLSSGL